MLFFICGPITLQIVLKPPPWPKESKSMLRFEIAWWEGGQKVEHTDRRTDTDWQIIIGIQEKLELKVVTWLCYHFINYELPDKKFTTAAGNGEKTLSLLCAFADLKL